jgi:hypothetical protein
MKRRTDKALLGLCLLVFTGCIFYLVYIFAIQEGISRGYEEANSQNQRMCFTRAKALGEAAYRGEIELGREYVRVFGAKIDSLRKELSECRG